MREQGDGEVVADNAVRILQSHALDDLGSCGRSQNLGGRTIALVDDVQRSVERDFTDDVCWMDHR